MLRKKNIDIPLIVFPFLTVTFLCCVFIFFPDVSKRVIDGARAWIGETLGIYYLVFGIASVALTLFFAFSKIGTITLGGAAKPEYSLFAWGSMIFTSTMAADILYYSFIEWALYAQEKRIGDLGSMQEWASVYPLFHWGPIPWSFYIVLALAFAYMMYVKGRTRQKFSEACRPLFGDKIDGVCGSLVDFIAIFSLLAGTATTFSLATPLLSAAVSSITGIPDSALLSVGMLICIAVLYTIAVLFSFKGIMLTAKLCIYVFFSFLVWVGIFGGETRYILETGFTALGNMIHYFIPLSVYTDPLRKTGFVPNWTVFYWAYWMVWCVATPFFIATVSKGRTVRNVVFGVYIAGLAGTFTSFIVFGNYGLALKMHGIFDAVENLAHGNPMPYVIVSIIKTLPFPTCALLLLIATILMFYSTTFDSLTMVVSMYSYRTLSQGEVPHKAMRAFWSVVFIIFPIGLIFSENSLRGLQSVSIIAALPISIVMILIVVSFIKDVTKKSAPDGGTPYN